MIQWANELYFKIIDLETQAGYARAVDWIAFMRYVLPTLVIEQIDKQQQEAKPDCKKDSNAIKDAKKALIALSKIYCLALQKEINVNEIGMMERYQYIFIFWLAANIFFVSSKKFYRYQAFFSHKSYANQHVYYQSALSDTST